MEVMKVGIVVLQLWLEEVITLEMVMEVDQVEAVYLTLAITEKEEENRMSLKLWLVDKIS